MLLQSAVMRNAVLAVILISLLIGCSADKQQYPDRKPKSGQWIDPQTNVRFTLEEKDGEITVTAAKDMDDRRNW